MGGKTLRIYPTSWVENSQFMFWISLFFLLILHKTRLTTCIPNCFGVSNNYSPRWGNNLKGRSFSGPFPNHPMFPPPVPMVLRDSPISDSNHSKWGFLLMFLQQKNTILLSWFIIIVSQPQNCGNRRDFFKINCIFEVLPHVSSENTSPKWQQKGDQVLHHPSSSTFYSRIWKKHGMFWLPNI